MNRFTLSLAVCALLAAGTDASARRLAVPQKHVRAEAAPKADKKAVVRRAVEAGALWRAATEKVYGWDGTKWDLDDTYNIAYDSEGRAVTEVCTDFEGVATRSAYTYNENCMMTATLVDVCEEAGGEFRNSRKVERTYDSRLTSYITGNFESLWFEDSWKPTGNNYTQTLTRNADGNVTLMERAVLFNGVFDPTSRLNVTYGADGKASALKESDLAYDYGTGQYVWEDGIAYTDIVWDRTDGQIVSTENLMSGANRIKSAVIVDGGDTMPVSFAYTADGGYTGTMSGSLPDYGVEYTSTIVYTPTDANGSCTVVTTTVYTADGESDTEVVRENYKYDEYGLIVLEEVTVGNGVFEEIETRIVGDIEYDTTHGYPLSFTVSEYDYDTEEMVNSVRIEYSDYTDAAGISDITADSADAPVEYFNLQGMRVRTPAPGSVCIRRQGARVEKVLVK